MSAVVVRQLGGNPELIKDGYSGFLVDVGDTSAIAQRVDRLLSDRNLRDALGKNAQQDAERNYGLDKMVSAYTDLYQSLLDRGSSVIS